MGKYGLYVVLMVILGFTGIIYYMAEQPPKMVVQVLSIAENSYFLGCAENLFEISGLPKDEIIVICKEESKTYRANMARFIGEEN